MVTQMETPPQLFNKMRYVNLINMTGWIFPSHGSLHPQLTVFVCMPGLSPMACALGANYIFYSPYLLLLAYKFPNYIATQKNPNQS
jgi:hypothetical protein